MSEPAPTPRIFRSAGSVTLLLIVSILIVQYAGAWYGLEIAKASKENDLQQHLEDVARLAQVTVREAAIGFAALEYDSSLDAAESERTEEDIQREFAAAIQSDWAASIESLVKQARLNEATLLGLNGAILYDTADPSRTLSPFEFLELDSRQFQSALQGGIGSTLAYDAGDTPLKRVYAPIRDGSERIIAVLCLTAGHGYLNEIGLLADYLQLISAISTVLVFFIGWMVYRILERQRFIERQAAHSERLAGLGQLAAGFAHEVRNPLEIIAASTEDLESSLRRAGSLPADAGESCKDILEEVERLNRLVSQFLQYSKAEGLPAEQGRVRLGESLGAALALLHRQAERRGIHLNSSEDRIDPGVSVAISDSSLRQIIMNLVMNAIQATPEKGSVEVRTEVQPREVTVRVSDTGPGVPPDLHERIFEPFFTTRSSGSGLGLAISHQLARTAGGRLTYEPSTGRGACFALTLPRVSP